MAGPGTEIKNNSGREHHKKERGEKQLKDSRKPESVQKMWLLKMAAQGRMRMMMGKTWGRCYMPGSGKLYGRFLGCRASVAHRRAYVVPHTELSPAAAASSPLLHPPSAAGRPWHRPCRDSCAERQKGDRRRQWDMSTRKKSRKGRWPRVTPRERCLASPEEGSSSHSRDFASGGCRNKEQQSWVGQSLFFLYHSNMMTCKPHDSLAVTAFPQRLAAKSNPGS